MLKIRLLFLLTIMATLTGCSVPNREGGSREIGTLTVISSTESDDYIQERITVKAGNKEVNGKLFLPQADKKQPLAIFCHGFNATYTSVEYLAKECAKKGMLTCVFDFCGGSKLSSSTGSMTGMSVMTERDDLNLMIDTLLDALSEIHNGEIYLCGWSQGGYVVTATATERPDDISGILLLAPAFHIDDFVHSCFAKKEDIPETISPQLGYHYFADIWDYDIYSEMSKYEKPVVIYHGDADTDVDDSYSERAAVAFPNAELTIMPGTTHIFTMKEFDRFAGAMEQMVFGQ